jgi:glycine dehydrogenase subunit 1
MMTRLTGLPVSNASMYDGASAMAEAVLMAERLRKKGGTRRVLVPRTVHPAYRKTLATIAAVQNIEVVELDYDRAQGRIDPAALDAAAGGEFTALIVPQPNFFGVLEQVDALTDWAHARGALTIAVVNPSALGLLKAPGEWGAQGADIACGEGQPLGVPLSSGGPYFGLLCCKSELVRQMPGRIVGRTTDLDGREGFALTLQAREQHIRRAKATSNICTNQGLLVTAATIYMALLGPEGLRRVAAACAANARALALQLEAIPRARKLFSGPFFHEFALALAQPARALVERLAGEGIVAGYALGDDYPELGEALLVCATETKNAEDLAKFSAAMARALA